MSVASGRQIHENSDTASRDAGEAAREQSVRQAVAASRQYLPVDDQGAAQHPLRPDHAGACRLSFTIAIHAAATGASTEATNLSVGIVDEDHSDLSRRIADGLTPPTFKPAIQMEAAEIDAAMNSQRFIFAIEFLQSSRPIFLPGGNPPFRSMSMPPRLPRLSMA